MNKIIRSLALISLITISLGLVGCTTRIVDYTLLSTKNVDLSKAGTFKRGPNRVTGVDSQMIIVLIPNRGPANLKAAVDDAIESVPGAVALVDGVVYSRNWNAIVVGENAIIAEGTPLIDPSIPGAAAFLKADRIVSFYDPATKKQVARAVDTGTYNQIKVLAQRHANAELSKMLLALQ
jgi:hypothetical protein